jgi:hypothetical protein
LVRIAEALGGHPFLKFFARISDLIHDRAKGRGAAIPGLELIVRDPRIRCPTPIKPIKRMGDHF